MKVQTNITSTTIWFKYKLTNSPCVLHTYMYSIFVISIHFTFVWRMFIFLMFLEEKNICKVAQIIIHGVWNFILSMILTKRSCNSDCLCSWSCEQHVCEHLVSSMIFIYMIIIVIYVQRSLFRGIIDTCFSLALTFYIYVSKPKF